MAGMYALYHGPAGLRKIAERIHGLTMVLAEGCVGTAVQSGWSLCSTPFGFRCRLDNRTRF